MPESTDHELMLLVGRGQPHLLAGLFDRHHVKLFSFFRKLGHPRVASEDLVQETFLRMLRYAQSYRESGHFSAWMYQIARNAAADARGHGQHEILLENAALDELHDERNGAAESLHTQHELERRLQRALLRLPGDKRELVLLSRVKELGTADLARLFGCSNSALKVRLHRSLTLLREFFDDGDTNP